MDILGKLPCIDGFGENFVEILDCMPVCMHTVVSLWYQECAMAGLDSFCESPSLLALISSLGQMIWLPYCRHLLFMSSPRLMSLDDFRNLKVYLSDIPLYDVTRELVLLNQQRIVEIDVAWVYACVRCWVILLLCVLLPRLNSYVFFLALCLFYQWQHNSIGAIGVCVHIINSHENCECM